MAARFRVVRKRNTRYLQLRWWSAGRRYGAHLGPVSVGETPTDLTALVVARVLRLRVSEEDAETRDRYLSMLEHLRETDFSWDALKEIAS